MLQILEEVDPKHPFIGVQLIVDGLQTAQITRLAMLPSFAGWGSCNSCGDLLLEVPNINPWF